MAKLNINMDSLKPRREWKRHKLAEGTATLRILPPFGEKAEGYPYKKWIVVWGLTDPATNKMKPIASPIMVENKCPVYEYLELIKAKLEDDKNILKAKGYSDQQVKDRFAEVNKIVGALRPRKTFAYNATDKSGSVGILEITSTAHKQLIALMHAYVQDYGQDPTSLNSADDDAGVWFNFGRTGKGLDTEYTVTKAQTKQKINNQMVFVDDRSPLSQNIVDDYENQGYDLFGLYKEKSYEETKEILMYNLKALVAKEPYLAVPGFDDFSNVPDMQAAPAGNGNYQGQQQQQRQASAPAANASKVNIKLGNPDDEGDDEEVKAKPAGASKPAGAGPANDADILSLADNLLNDI